MKSQLKNYDAVIFDMDGVIFDSERLVRDVWISMEDEWGIQGIGDIFPECIGNNREATRLVFMKHWGEDFPYWEFRDAARAKFISLYDKGRLPMKTGVRELLSWLRAEEIQIALASSTTTDMVKTQLSEAGILSFFQQVVGGDMVGRSKPEPDIFLKAAELLQVDPTRCYVIEDSHFGIRAAASAGMHPIMVPDMMPVTDLMQDLAEVILDDLLQVQNFLQEKGDVNR